MCWGVGRDVGRSTRGRCRKKCWGVGKVRGDVGKGEVRKEMWESVLGPHTPTHFPTSPHIFSPHANTLPLPIHSLVASNFATLSYTENLHCLHRNKTVNSQLP